MSLSPAALIAHKRDGGEHSPDEIRQLIASFASGTLTDYQMTAWLMATYLRGLSDGEMIALTEAMLHSGTVLKRQRGGLPRVDKHSTGGVGDKISLPLAPLVACFDVRVPMIAGRGLGHTGGTLDKLESIPGYNTQLGAREFQKTVVQIGASIIGQTKDIAPVDKRIYALRDVTGTVACRPLIVASILSKKLAEALDGLVLDVKVGRGAFMTEEKSARALAKSLVQVAGGLGTQAVARLTRMDAPLGTTIGNALEVKESLELLQGGGPSDSRELTLTLAEEMLLLAGRMGTRAVARGELDKALKSGVAFEKFREMVSRHGGDVRAVDDPSRLPSTKQRQLIRADKAGFVSAVDSLALAEVALALGAGRRRSTDAVDPAVGIEVHVKLGERIEKEQKLLTLHVRKRDPKLAARALSAVRVSRRRVRVPELLLGRAIRS